MPMNASHDVQEEANRRELLHMRQEFESLREERRKLHDEIGALSALVAMQGKYMVALRLDIDELAKQRTS
jgi:uncharacterized protein YlxW (UPF0749 family)